MLLLTEGIRGKIEDCLIPAIKKADNRSACKEITDIISLMYDAIPPNKRISYGIVHTVKELGKYLFEIFISKKISVFKTASDIFDCQSSSESKTVALCMLSIHGIDEPDSVLPYFEKAAADDDWEVREISQILFRKLIKPHQGLIKKNLLKLVKSDDANVRRFVGETLRPVCENKWFYLQPEYSLSILKHLFSESKPYPRTSVGNNLSDLARHLPELVYEIVKELVTNGDKNSYWIATRACRNLVKKEPDKVMNLLKTDFYKYKKSIYKKDKND